MLFFDIFIIDLAGLCFGFFNTVPGDSVEMLFLDGKQLTTISQSSVMPLQQAQISLVGSIKFILYFPEELPLRGRLSSMVIFQFDKVGMNRLFAISFRRIAGRLGAEELPVGKVGEVLEGRGVGRCGEGLLYRLPREELKHIINIPCPVNSLEGEDSQLIIESAKKLRNHGRIKQSKICFKCPFKSSCAVAGQSYEGEIDHSAKELMIFWSALNSFVRPDQIYFRQWTSAYKLGDSIIAALEDLEKGGEEIQEYDKLRIETAQKHLQKERQNEQEGKGKDDVKYEQIVEKVSATYSSETIKPKTKDTGKARLKEMAEEDAVFGRDVSFDEDEQFQPQATFTRETYKEPPPRKVKPLNKQKGYQRIQRQQEDNHSKMYRKQDRAPRQYQQTYKNKRYEDNYKPRQYREDNYQQKRYNEDNYNSKRYGEERYDKKYSREDNYAPKYQKKQRRYQQEQDQDFYQRNTQKYNKKQGKNINIRQRFDQEDERDVPYYRYLKKDQYQNDRNRSAKENYQKERPKQQNNDKAFISKWQPEQQFIRDSGRPNKSFDKNRQNKFQKYQQRNEQNSFSHSFGQSREPKRQQKAQKQSAPKIVEFQGIEPAEARQPKQRAGRRIRRTSRSGLQDQ